VRHLLSGALLALFGLGILFADAHSVRSARAEARPRQENRSTHEGSVTTPRREKSGSLLRLV
jgi:hypothetical protein